MEEEDGYKSENAEESTSYSDGRSESEKESGDGGLSSCYESGGGRDGGYFFSSEDEQTSSDCSSSSSADEDDNALKSKRKSYSCHICGRKTRKASLLKQHLLTHSNERPFICPVEKCKSKYKTKFHLDRHMISKHEVRVERYACSFSGCTYTTSNSDLFKRHSNLHKEKGKLERHRDKSSDVKKPHVCQEENCGKAFKYPSQLRYHHEEKHSGQLYVDVMCSEPGCGEHFDHLGDLSQHMKNAHKYVFCEVCGKVCLRANIKRHYRSHDSNKETKVPINCPYAECSRTYGEERNLRKHIKIAHLGFKPYQCSRKNCGKWFAWKHVRDHHEKALHVSADFLDEDLKASKRRERKNKGGRKRTVTQIEDMFVKRPCVSHKPLIIIN